MWHRRRVTDGIDDGIDGVFARVGARGWLHARCVTCGRDTGLDADRPVVLASVVKVLLVTEFARQVAAGQLDPTERARARGVDRLGGLGTAGCLDDVECSLRDLAYLAMSLSDNTAADLLFARVGTANVRSHCAELGLSATRVGGGPRDQVRSMLEDVGAADDAEFAATFPTLTVDGIRSLRALDPDRTANASTPRDLTRLLALIWRDEAGPPEACAEVRRLMSVQANWHRLAAAFRPEVRVWAKSGSLPLLRNEIGVATYPDGGSYAVAVCTEVGTLVERRPDVDHAIGDAARLALESLRAAGCTVH
jgi:beta-lactamase class A